MTTVDSVVVCFGLILVPIIGESLYLDFPLLSHGLGSLFPNAWAGRSNAFIPAKEVPFVYQCSKHLTSPRP